MSDCVVFGATGYTGREVVRQAAQRGRSVVAHVRPDSARLEHWGAQFSEWGASVDASPWQLDAIVDCLSRHQPRAVFALLGTTRARARQARRDQGADDSYESVDYGLTALLLQAACVWGGRPKFVYLSAAGVRPDSRGAYMSARARVEQELRQSGLPFVIARPSFITGPDRDESRPGERIGASLADAALSVFGALGARRLSQRYRSTSNRVLAGALLRAAFDPDCVDVVLESEALR